MSHACPHVSPSWFEISVIHISIGRYRVPIPTDIAVWRKIAYISVIRNGISRYVMGVSVRFGQYRPISNGTCDMLCEIVKNSHLRSPIWWYHYATTDTPQNRDIATNTVMKADTDILNNGTHRVACPQSVRQRYRKQLGVLVLHKISCKFGTKICNLRWSPK